MKKIVSIALIAILLIGGLFILTGCGDKKEEETVAPKQEVTDYSKMTADDLLAIFAKDPNNIITENYIALISTYANVKIQDDLTLEENITDEAIKKISSKAKPSLDSYLGTLLESNAPQVRGYGISLITSLTGVSSKNLELAKKLIKDETNEYVLYCATKALSNEAKSSKEVADFLIKMASHENAKIRNAAASALGNSWSKGVEGATDTIIKLMNDTDKDVRKTACKYSGKLADEAVIEPLVTILNNNDDADIHGSCIEGLVYLWYDYPFFANTSEKAYNATMDYLRKTPRTDKIPAWTAVGSFKTVPGTDSGLKSFNEWKEKATYFKTDDIYNVMVDIIKDGNASYLARTSAMDVIKAHCGDEKFSELKAIVDGLTDSSASTVKSSYDNKATK